MQTRKIRPLHDLVLIQRQPMESMSHGGLHIPESRQVKSRYGEVLAVGPGRFKKGTSERVPVALKSGDVVLMKGTTSVRGAIQHEGEELIFLREDEIEAVVVEP